MQKVVIDTNVFISVILGGFVTGAISEALLAGEFKLVYSPALLDELKDVLERPQFEFDRLKRDKILTFIETNAELVVPKEQIFVCRDPKDNPILECAVAGKVDVIVTGDKDLLVLNSFRKILILSPREFLKTL